MCGCFSLVAHVCSGAKDLRRDVICCRTDDLSRVMVASGVARGVIFVRVLRGGVG